MKTNKKYSLVRKLKEQQIQHPQQMSDFAPVPQKPVSLDQIVDRYIVRYERESIPLEGEEMPGIAPPLEESVDVETLLTFLLEQAPPNPDEEEDPAAEDPTAEPMPAADEPAPDMGMDAPDAASPTGEAPPVMNTPRLNLNNFTRSIARLINNFDALLNPRSILMNRVEAYIKANYDERTSKAFVQTMERNYSIKGTEVEYPSDDENEFPTPVASQPGVADTGSPSGGG